MTNEEKITILKLRDDGKGYGEISRLTGISKNSISTFICIEKDKKYNICLACYQKLIQTPGHRQKLFCIDTCRRLNWIQKGRKNIKMKEFKCKCCGRTFFGYESQHPSFCSRECFFKPRRGDDDETNSYRKISDFASAITSLFDGNQITPDEYIKVKSF